MRRFLCLGLGLAALAGLAAGVAGCAAVRPYEREYLSDRIMSYEADSRSERVEQKWLEAREGSTGGAAGAGGGCACN